MFYKSIAFRLFGGILCLWSMTSRTSLRLGLLRCLFGGDFGAVILVIVDSTVVILVDCLVAHGWAGPICLILEGLEHEMPQLKRE